MDIIETLRNSKKELLEAQAKDFEKWSKLKHTKEDLNLFLNFNIANIKFQKKNNEIENIICTSNIFLIDILKNKKDVLKKNKFDNKHITKIETNNIIKTYDMIHKHTISIPLKDWSIINFISITPENIKILQEVLENIL